MKKSKITLFSIIAILFLSIASSLVIIPSASARPCGTNIDGECTLNDQSCYQAGRFRACKKENILGSQCIVSKLADNAKPNDAENMQRIHDFCTGHQEIEDDSNSGGGTLPPSNGNNDPGSSGGNKPDPGNNDPGNNNPGSGPNSFFDEGDCDQGFLGLIPWSCGVSIKDEESLKSGIWKIVANIATDITIIAAYLVIIYVIYGGYLYIMSGGDSNKVATGKKTLTHAFIGLAIVMTAYLILNSIRIALLGADGTFSNCATEECVNAGSMFINAIQWVVGIAGAVAVIFIVYGGISYATSTGDSGKLQKAKQIILYSLIGLAIVAFAEIITAFVSNIIRNANETANSTSYINQTIISKEVNENHTN